MITKDQAINLYTGATLYHLVERNADGTALRVRKNGKVKTWKSRPDEWRMPVKYGLKKCFYVDHNSAGEWLLADPTEEEETE